MPVYFDSFISFHPSNAFLITKSLQYVLVNDNNKTVHVKTPKPNPDSLITSLSTLFMVKQTHDHSLP